MNIMNENVIVKECDFKKPLIQKIDSLIDISIRDCHYKYFYTFDHVCEYDLISTNLAKNETVNFTTSDKNMGLYELNKKLTVARQRGFILVVYKKAYDTSRARRSVPHHISVQNQVAFLRKDARRKTQKIKK